MSNIARVGDRTDGLCTDASHKPHVPFPTEGTITSGASKTVSEGSSIARVGDTVTGDCGHTGAIDSGAPKSIVEGQPIARVGDTFSGTYSGTITSGANKSSAG